LGILHFNGVKARPKYFTVHYDDGSTETGLDIAAVQPLLMPLGTPAPTIPAAPQTLLATVSELPELFDLTSVDGLHAALNLLMPGDWTTAHLTRLAHMMPGQPRFLQGADQQRPGEPECVVTSQGEMDALLRCVDLSSMATIIDPFSGTQGVANALRARGLQVITNDINPSHQADMHLDALQPHFYRVLQAKGVVDAIVMSPWFAVLDLALPLAVAFSRSVVACHVPGHFITSAHPARYAWFRTLKQQGRLHLVMGLPRGSMGMKCVWLIVFASSKLRSTILHATVRADGILSF
jgi:hypothetical protein